MVEYLSLKEAADLLGYTDLRSVEVWCEDRHIPIFGESKCRVIVRLQFEAARLAKFIVYLKRRYAERWVEALEAFLSNNIMRVLALDEPDSQRLSSRSKHTPLGEQERKFFDALTETTHAL